MKAIKIGIMPQERIRARVLAIARGKLKPRPSEPRIWFTSMKSLAEVLSDDNRARLKVIREARLSVVPGGGNRPHAGRSLPALLC